MKIVKPYQTGLSLVELMVSIAIGLVLLAGVISLYSNSVGSSSGAMRTAKLNQELRAVMLMMANDIRRAGFRGDANAAAAVGTGATTNANPFRAIDTANTGCILFSYDQNNDGAVTTTTTLDERFGYRLSNGRIESRTGGAGCTGSGWQALTDSRAIAITGLTFVPDNRMVNGPDRNADGTPDLMLMARTITISLTGRLTSDATVSRTLTESVRIRNDLLCTSSTTC